MVNTSSKRFAVLIDADNVPLKDVGRMMDKISELGTLSIRRAYADWTKFPSNYQDIMVRNQIEVIQQPRYTAGKNATDIRLVIAAMDILCNYDHIDAFCIISSDSDFAALATHLRGKNKYTVALGRRNTPEPFKQACDRFIELESLPQTPLLAWDTTIVEAAGITQEVPAVKPPPEPAKPSKQVEPHIIQPERKFNLTDKQRQTIRNVLTHVMGMVNHTDNGVDVQTLGMGIKQYMPTFKREKYGLKTATEVALAVPDVYTVYRHSDGKTYVIEKDEAPRLSAPQNPTQSKPKPNPKTDSPPRIVQMLNEAYDMALENATGNAVSLSALGSNLRKIDPDFNVKHYGHSQLKKLVLAYPKKFHIFGDSPTMVKRK